MSINRELSQLASFIDVQEDNNFIGISTGGTYTVGIGTSSVIIGATGIITATQFNGPTGSSLIDHIDLQDEGNPVGTGFTTLNFVGTGVSVTEGASGIATVTIIGTEIIGTAGEIDTTDNGDGTTTLSLPNQVAITSSLTVGTVKIESGIITATSGIVTYNGDGSGLINVPSSALSGLSTDSEKLDGQQGSYYLDYANFVGVATDSDKLDGEQGSYYLDYANFVGVATDADKLDGQQGTYYLDYSNFVGVATDADKLDGQQGSYYLDYANFVGVATDADKLDGQQGSYYLDYANFVGVATDSDKLDGQEGSYYLNYSNFVGVATDADKLDGQDGTYYLNYSNFVGVATDSDKLDGQEGSYYLDYSNFTNTPLDGRWVETAVGIWTSSSVGIGTTNPTGKLEVHGNARITGILTVGSSSITIDGDNDQLNVGSTVTINSTGYTVGNSFLHSTGLDGENLNITGISTLGTVQISSGIITASSGIVTYYGDGTNLTLTDSVALGGDTTGDYVASISGTANQIAVDVTSGEGTTPVISIPNNPTLPGTTVTIENDLQVNRDLNVTGNITIGGTSATLFTQTLSVADADLILGVRTDANGNDVSNDTTASHGGIAIASTEGTPLVTLVNPGAGETLPPTYKKIMWFEQGSFAGLGTDAWLINYGVGIGSTQVPNNVVLAAGDVHVTNNDIIKVGDINASGIITASTFVSNVSTGTSPLTVTSTTLVSNLNADKLDGQEGTYYLNYANFSGIATDSDKLDGQQGTYYLDYANFSGIATDSDKLDGQQGTYYLSYNNFVGLATDSDKLDGQDGSYYLNYSNFSGIATDSDKLDGQQGSYYLDYANFSGIATDSDKLDGQQGTYYLNYANFVGLATDSDKLDGQQGSYYLDYANFSGIATDSDKLDGQQGTYYLSYSNFVGLATDSDKLDGQQGSYYLNYANFSGIATDSDKLDGQQGTYYLNYANFSGIATDSDKLDGQDGTYYLNYSNFVGVATDADKLDGIQASSFLRSDQSDTMSGNLTMGTNYIYGDITTAWLRVGSQAEFRTVRNITIIADDDDSSTTEALTLGAGQNQLKVTSNGATTDNNKLTYNGNIVWHAGNDGSLSGLNADKLDGQEGSYYLNYSNFSGIATDSDKLDGQQGTYYLDYSNFVGVATDSDKLDGQQGTYYLDYSNFVGVATDSSLLDGIDSNSFLRSDAADFKTSGNLTFNDSIRLQLGTGGDLELYHNGSTSYIKNSIGNLHIENQSDNSSIIIRTDDGSGGDTNYIDCNGLTGEVRLFHYGAQKLATKANGIDVTGHTETDTLNVSGIATAQDFNSASDENLKTNIRTIEDPLAKVVQIRGVNFDWKETQRPSLGVIAQEVEKVLPELVTDNGTKTVNYNGLIGLLIETVKEQQKQIDTLSERLSKLE